MKKTVSRVLVLAMLLYLCMPIASYVYAKENVGIVVNDVCVDELAFAETLDDRLYVSARSIANPMGLNLEWNDVKKTLIILHRETTITLIAGSNLAIVDNNPIELEQPLRIMADRAIVDLGFLCNTLGAAMTFDEADNTYRVVIDVPEDFEPDVIKPAEIQQQLLLYAEDAVNTTKVTELAKALELDVLWDDSVKSVTLSSESGDTLTLYAGDSFAIYNGDVLECSAPLTITDDVAYTDCEFVEKLFTVQLPQNYMPARQVADKLGLTIDWADETKTLSFVDENGDRLSMMTGSCYYKLNDKFFSNSAPLILRDGVSYTDCTVIDEAFHNRTASVETDGAGLFSSSKEFSGQLVLEKALSSYTYINVTVISVQSIVYTNSSGLIYTDYNTQMVYVPANTRNVDFSVTKTNWDYYDSYIIGYSFLYSNNYYYDLGYLAYDGSIRTSLTAYSYYYTLYEGSDLTNDIVIIPRVYSYVTLDDVIFSGVVKCDDGVTFGAGSCLNISVRSTTYYGENIIAYTEIYPGNTDRAGFSVTVPNDSGTRNRSVYLCYRLYNGDSRIIEQGYYESPTSSVKKINRAKGWNIRTDNLSNINFAVIEQKAKTVISTFNLPEGVVTEPGKDLDLSLDILTVQSDVYSNKQFIPYMTIDDAATIKSGESNAACTLEVVLDESELYIFRYRINGHQNGIFPYGYATTGVCSIYPEHALIYSGSPDYIYADFIMQDVTQQYQYINNLPYNVMKGIVSTSQYIPEYNKYFAGYYLYLTEGQNITIKLKSSEFDAYLRLLDENMSLIAYNDDSLGNGNALISRYISESGYYYIQATTFDSYDTGKFSLFINSDRALSGGTTFMDSDYNTIGSLGNISSVTADYKIENTQSQPEKIKLAMAVYDSNNAMIGIETKDVVVDTGISDAESLTLDLRNYRDVAKIKSFIWTDNLTSIGNVDSIYK